MFKRDFNMDIILKGKLFKAIILSLTENKYQTLQSKKVSGHVMFLVINVFSEVKWTFI